MLIEEVKIIIFGREFWLHVKYASGVQAGDVEKVGKYVCDFAEKSASATEHGISEVRKYVSESARAIGEEVPEDLFLCLEPHYLFVNLKNGEIYIALLFGFSIDCEHDLAMIFRDGEMIKVGSQDLIASW